MLTYRGLVELAQQLGGQTILSVYVNGEVDDPARRRRWRIELRHALDEVEGGLRDADHAVREQFAVRRVHAESRLEALGATVKSPGWAGFYTPDGEVEAGPLPVSVPTLAVWGEGPFLAPYVRAMKEALPVVVVVGDQAHVRLYRYQGLQTQPVETIRAHTKLGQLPHMSRPPRVGFHSGTRGLTATDKAQRELQAGTERMLHDAVGRLTRHAGSDGWIVVGGIPEIAAAIVSRLPANLAARTVRRSLDIHSQRPLVAEAARAGAGELRAADDLRRVESALGSAEGDGRGAAGAADTMRALAEGSVRELYFTGTFLRERVSEAESAVRLALQQHASVEHVSGPAEARLDEAGGIAALLRYSAWVPAGTATPS